MKLLRSLNKKQQWETLTVSWIRITEFVCFIHAILTQTAVTYRSFSATRRAILDRRTCLIRS